MGWLTKVGNILTGGLVKDVGEAIDKNITSDEERAQLKNEFQAIVQKYSILVQEQVSQRHQTDMASDSWLSKNVRPLFLIANFAAVTLFAFGSGAGWLTVDPMYVSLYEKLLIAGVMFYFGGRSAEKWKAIRGKE